MNTETLLLGEMHLRTYSHHTEIMVSILKKKTPPGRFCFTKEIMKLTMFSDLPKDIPPIGVRVGIQTLFTRPRSKLLALFCAAPAGSILWESLYQS